MGCGGSTEAQPNQTADGHPLNEEAGNKQLKLNDEAAKQPTNEAAKLTKEEVYVSANLASIQTLDEDLASEQVNGDMEILQELHTMVREQYKTSYNEIKQAYKEGDYARVASSAHALKGAMCNLGANRFAKLSGLLENYGRELQAIIKAGTPVTEDQTHLVSIYIALMAGEWQEYLTVFQDFIKRTAN
mmetsp:Transcript_12837/g.23119  ORF Transcript_12837/g.23119 Transcript_12837/m.23119 type:complete len:188 (-) Transcript_12837:882-1445(-)